MNSRVIKFVAGAGKTTKSIEIMKNNRNGLYIAFNNKIVDEVASYGLLSKTIDSLFQNYIIPKCISFIPIIGNGKKIIYCDVNSLPGYLTNVRNIKIDDSGCIYNKSAKTDFSLFTQRDALINMKSSKNYNAVSYIFGNDEVRLTDEIRAGISLFLLKKYSEIIVNILKERFEYIIIDEAQDLNHYREEFAKILFNSEMPIFVLGDEFQNINNGGTWFKNLKADEECKNSFRCPENNCKWIRENLSIDIFGVDENSEIRQIEYDEVEKYDNGKTALLYPANSGKNRMIISNWNGPKMTIKTSKGLTIKNDIAIIGKSLNKNNMYTAITRTTKNVYYTFKVDRKEIIAEDAKNI